MTIFPVATEALDLEIYLLSAIVCGNDGLKSIEKKMQGLGWVRSTFEASEFSRRLISLAVILRCHLDSIGRLPDTEVGSLIPIVESQNKREPLALREACNKIIHAEEIILRNSVDPEQRGELNIVTLAGSLHKKQWAAEVNILKFLNSASNHS